MPQTDYILLVLGMGLVTYIPRCFPLVFLSQWKLPEWLIDWLDLIPVAILGALVFADLFTVGEPRHVELFQRKSLVALPTFVIALKFRSLGMTVIAGMLLFWLAGKVL